MGECQAVPSCSRPALTAVRVLSKHPDVWISKYPMTRIPGYNFASLDEQTKRMVRHALLKAVADQREDAA